MQTIKKNWIYFLFAFAVVLFAVSRFINHRGMVYINYKTIHSDSLGWGYDIYSNKKILVHQIFIPAIEGKKGFVSEEQAATIAKLIIAKMSVSKAFPSVTVHDLDSCGITR